MSSHERWRNGSVAAVLALLLVTVAVSCDLAVLSEGGASVPPITVGEVRLERSVRDTQRYRITLSVLNQSADTLQSLQFHAVVSAPAPDETFLQRPITVESTVDISGATRRTVEYVLESPFPVVPPTPLLLEEIRVGRAVFRRSNETTYRDTRWVLWPWPVEEVR